jgi:selenocysteine lyase/cysteine desulfurase
VLGAIEYLADLGAAYGQVHSDILIEKGYSGRRLDLKKALMAIRAYEFDLSRAILETLKRIPGLTLYGLDDVRKVEMRVPTFSFRLEDIHPQRAAELLAKEHIYVWDGNYYALGITERLGVEEQGGMVRVGTAHYNTLEEISRLENVLMRIVRK